MLETIVFQTAEQAGVRAKTPEQNSTNNNIKFRDVLEQIQAETKTDDTTDATHTKERAQDTEEDPNFGFGDLIDMINPLHHIPLVGEIYRNISGDEIKPFSRITGGAIFGGITGAGSALANVIVKHETGDDIAGNILNMAAGNTSSSSFPSQNKTPDNITDNPVDRLNRAVANAESGPFGPDNTAREPITQLFLERRYNR